MIWLLFFGLIKEPINFKKPYEPSYEKQLVACQQLGECLHKSTKLIEQDGTWYSCRVGNSPGKFIYGHLADQARSYCEWMKK